MTLTSKLDNILAQCRAVLALADKATPGPWKAKTNHPPYKIVWIKKSENYSTLELEPIDADFIATSRTLTPRLASATITAIEALRTIAWIKDRDDALVPKRDGSFLGTTAFNTLQRIADEWEAP